MMVCSIGQPCVEVGGQSGNTVMLNIGGVPGVGKCGVGGIMVLCVSRRYTPVLALRTSQSLRVRNPTTGMFFDLIYKNPFSTSSKLWLLRRIIHRWEGMSEEIAAPLES